MNDYFDDDEALKKRALPLDDTGDTPSDAGDTPMSASHYLRLVRQEAAACPQVVVAPTSAIPIFEKASNSDIPNVRDVFRGGFQEGDDVPAVYKPSQEWERTFLDKFEKLRNVVAQCVQRQYEFERPFEVPPKGDRAWRVFCYGESTTKTSRELRAQKATRRKERATQSAADEPAFTEAMEVDTATYEDLQPVIAEEEGVEEGEIEEEEDGVAEASAGVVDEETSDNMEDQNETEQPLSVHLRVTNETSPPPPAKKQKVEHTFEDEGPSLDEVDTDPYLDLVAYLTQGQAIQLLKYHLQWLSNDDVTNQQLRWLFALLARIDPLLTGDEISVVREMCRKCRRIRARLAAQGVKEVEPRIAGLNMIIAIVGGPFAQGDLR
ncbi:gem (nuclear organelle) associated protein 2 [Rhizophlyctis rosea]|nr:gem (nuclear organelle) associated protein 2 [Rhizophlyctis rosea]